MLSIDIVGPLPADHRQGIPHHVCRLLLKIYHPRSLQQSHRKPVSEALLRHVVPYFGTPRRLLSDSGYMDQVVALLRDTAGSHLPLPSRR